VSAGSYVAVSVTGRFPRRTDRGSASIELTLLVPVLVLVLGLLVAGGRLWFARTTVAEAAQTGARAASLARTAGAATTAGRDAATASLATAGLRCDGVSVQIRTAAFAVPVGTPATVGSVVRCTVPLADIALPGLPGSIALTGTGAAALDTYRSR
jgi:Flp pilus assembly protein TadG